MSNPGSDPSLTSKTSRLTSDKGLGFDGFPAEKIKYFYNKGRIVGFVCQDFNELQLSGLEVDRPETAAEYKKTLQRQFETLNARLYFLHQTNTSCLLKAAVAFHQLLILWVELADEANTIQVAESLLRIYGEVEKRTRSFYQVTPSFHEKDMFRPLPQEMLSDFPLNQFGLWKRFAQRNPATRSRSREPIPGSGLIPLADKEDRPVDEKALDAALEKAMAEAQHEKELDDIRVFKMPLVREYLTNLADITLQEITKQTRVEFAKRGDDVKLSELVEIIFYASCVTVVLNKDGEPFDRDGIYDLFHYGMVPPAKKFRTIRFTPPAGKYVSLGRLPEHQFSFDGKVVKRIPFKYQPMLSFTQKDVTGVWPADYEIEATEAFKKNDVTPGLLVVKSAFSQDEITLSSLGGSLPIIVEDTMPHLFNVVQKKAQLWFTNYQELLKEIGEEVLKEFVIRKVKKLAVEYVVKKIGKHIIPVINAVAALESLVDAMTGKNSLRDNTAASCVRLYIKGLALDDQTLALKILANILGDELEDEIKSAIINKASDVRVKLFRRVGRVRKDTSPANTKIGGHGSLPEPIASPAVITPKPKNESISPNDAEVVRQGLQAFQDTLKAHEEARALKNRATNRTPAGTDTDASAAAANPITKHGEKDRTTEDNGLRVAAAQPDEDTESGKSGAKKEEQGEDKDQAKKPRSEKEDQDEEDKTLTSGRLTGTRKSSLLLPINIYTTPRQFRKQLADYFRANPNHPLIALFDSRKKRLKSSTDSGMDEFYWFHHPEAVQAGHVTSKHTGAPDKIIIMTAHENQMWKSTIEGKKARASVQGNFKVAIIEGLPISLESARHLRDFGKLTQKALDEAHFVNVDDL